MNNKLVNFENTNFIWTVNFSGDPERDKYGSTKRQACVIIPDVDMAMDLMDEGFNVKPTEPKEGEEEGFVPKYFIRIQANYNSKWPPKIYLGSADTPYELLNENTVGEIDSKYITNVDVILNKYDNDGKKSLYIKSMYVTYDISEDPYAYKYRKNKYNVEKLAYELDNESAYELLKLLEDRFA